MHQSRRLRKRYGISVYRSELRSALLAGNKPACPRILATKLTQGAFGRLLHALRRTISSLLVLIPALGCGLIAPAHATLVIGGTRVIYPEAYKSVTVSVSNHDEEPVLMQSWMTDARDEAHPAIPFAIAEPLVKIEPGRSSGVRIFYAGDGIPPDRESMFFLNIVGIPVKPAMQNAVQFAIKQRLKLFYRPQALHGTVSDAVAALRWQIDQDRLEVVNASPFHVSLIDLDVQWQDGHLLVSDYVLLQPGATKRFDVTLPRAIGRRNLRFVEINDIGLQVPHGIDLH